MTDNKKRVVFFSIFSTLIIVEVIIALFVHDKIIRPFGGDVIVVLVVYFFVRIFFPVKIRLLPLYVFIFAVIIETLQYFNFIELIGLENISFFQTVLGTSFSWIDIGCYALGCMPLVVYEIIRCNRKNTAKKTKTFVTNQ
ncbi:MAG: DUF2809 domain-containing protein [Eubacteriales bacterium]